MERYIGMDVHAASCTVAVISQTAKRLKDFPVETNGQALVEAVRMIPGRKYLVFEEGLQSAWLYETLSPHVDEIVVATITESLPPSVHAPTRTLADPHDAGRRRCAGAGSDQEPVPIAPKAMMRILTNDSGAVARI
jgi:hypothetical protein